MAESPQTTCWLSGGDEHCVVTTCTPDQSQASCDTKHANAVTVLQAIYRVDP